ncbi:MAG: hypothetical protein BWK76_01010 [Desulfobulbaceae bacterium A2]|nr:MAG: hypothetical protein BWK76_01010 [Desulfobulbaceae bacterium A2]
MGEGGYCAICGNDLPADAAGRCPYCGAALPAVVPRTTAVPALLHRTVNLELGRPRVAQALARLERFLAEATRQGCRVLTIIHGYGSSGSGGAIREEVRRQLSFWRDQGRIVTFIPGEDFSRRALGRDLRQRYPLLAGHEALGRRNSGITLVCL